MTDPPRIAVIGARGQLGSDLITVLGEDAIPLGHADLELTDPASIDTALGVRRPTHVINCAAYNLVDKAEEEPEAAFRVNAFGTRYLAQWCARSNVVLLHVSTDYVFGLDPDRCIPWSESDATGPVSAYGASKLAGEHFVRSICPRHFVVRTCGLYGQHAPRGKGNFVETMVRLGRERTELKIVADQRCTPTSTADLANALTKLVRTDAFGLYHATNSGDCSWFEFASEIFRVANLPVKAIPVTAAEYGAKARRPDYSVLETSRLANVIGGRLPTWQDALARYLQS
ncbi:MAG: dTDP-4-dehydrorhamnose reductase [Planctomycetes bacterium]|nr:dTDP-4-dehydrorhamnose reductase [Planctomycetota bacterium]